MSGEEVPVSTRRWPHELIRASAGTGKTFQISNRILVLLEAGVEMQRVLASTFTRKAAGEILGRVLLRLARAAVDDAEALRLATQLSAETGADSGADVGSGTSALDRERARALLESVVGALHHADVGTLDAFFVRLARCFGPELGLPLSWRIAEADEQEEARSRAVQALLDAHDDEALLELLRMIARGDHDRRVHDRLVEQVDGLQEVLREIEPSAPDPWSPFADREPVGDPERTREELADRVAAIGAPLTARGDPDSRWASALEAAAAAIREGAWEALWTTGLGAKWLAGEEAYYRKPFPEELSPALEEARRLARAELGPKYDAQARALGQIALLYDAALSDLQDRTGAYRFQDLAYRVGSPGPLAARPDLSYRMDRRSEHLLLDEFQDTSITQWAALEPLADAIERRGSLVVVADPKQSIYGWRNADPELVDRVERRYDLPSRTLSRSWRSSPVVLEFVNRLFGEVAVNPVLDALDEGASVARTWGATFEPHEPADPLRDAPGHVTVEVGPDDGGTGSDRPRLMAFAAERVAGIHERLPGAQIGVLVNRNDTVARLILELRRRGVMASEEGGTTVDDAAPVSALLSLLWAADHPGDTLARYEVAAGPLGGVVGYTDFTDETGARRLGARVRRRLLRQGYGEALSAWTRELAPFVDESELRRLEQLVELGFRWDERATLRPGDFIRYVESHTVEDPRSAAVRVMTVHQAKGLEFDVVVLPELDFGLHRRGTDVVMPERDPATGRIVRVFPYIGKKLRPLFPEAEEAYRQMQASHLRDRLSWLYVAVTRARHALHLLVAADEGERLRSVQSYARLVRAALGRAEGPVHERETLLELGDADWAGGLEGLSESLEIKIGAEPRVRVDAGAPRTRVLARRSPSELEGGGEVDLERLLRLDTSAARRSGTIVHRWCEAIGWIEDGIPEDAALRALVVAEAFELPGAELERLAERFAAWMRRPPVRDALSRKSAEARARAAVDPGCTLELHRERPFACRVDGEVMSGVIDRLVLVRSGPGASGGPGAGAGAVVAAEVLDFKTDDLVAGDEAALAARTEFYRPQIEAYREAVAATYGLPRSAVRGRLVFLAPGEVREVGE